MTDYLYSLVRYVPDMQRMEPTNVGIILQGAGRLDIKLSPHAAKRSDIDTAIFQQWRNFLFTEIKEDEIPLFQPRKTSKQFFHYLRGLCDETVILSETLVHQSHESLPFELVLSQLYERLVAPRPTASGLPSDRPTGRFREISKERGFERRGMKAYAHLFVNSERLWMPYRQFQNEATWAFDKVEVDLQIGRTANEIERLPTVQQNLRKFLDSQSNPDPKYYVLVDPFEKPFTNQEEREFDAMREDLEQALEGLVKDGAKVVRDKQQVDELACEIDCHLPLANTATEGDGDATIAL